MSYIIEKGEPPASAPSLRSTIARMAPGEFIRVEGKKSTVVRSTAAQVGAKTGATYKTRTVDGVPHVYRVE